MYLSKLKNILPRAVVKHSYARFGSSATKKEETVTLEFCRKAPKVELHAHLHGCIRPSTLQEYLTEKNVKYTPEEFKTKDMKGAFRIFDLIHAAIDNLKQIDRISEELFEDFAKENVVYLELRSTPRHLGSNTADDYVALLLDKIAKFEQKQSQMKIRLLLSVSRAEDIEKARETLALAKKYKSSGYILGIDYSGNPFQKTFTYFQEVFQEARDSNLKTVVHCAELPDEKTLQETYDVLKFKPDRVGHFNYFNDELFNTIHELNIPIEMCPTSNKFTMYLKDYHDHHFIKYYKTKHPLCLCTDDTVVFDTNISEEYYRMLKAFNFTEEQAKEVIKRSYECVFDEKIKQELRQISL